jgi:hypothetical protein
MDQQAATDKNQLELTLEPYQMIIQLDAWNIRERDDWGKSATLRRAGKEPERWHWVYTGTCFGLDHRGQTAGGRPVITERGFVSTRQGIDALREQLHAESLRRGLGQAASALVIGDGAVWIWRLASDRFPQARQRLDFYHAVQHLAAVGRALVGDDKVKFKAMQWLHSKKLDQPLFKLKRVLGYSGGTLQSSNPDLTHIKFFTRNTLQKMMQGAGFKPARFRNADFVERVFPYSMLTRDSLFYKNWIAPCLTTCHIISPVVSIHRGPNK